MSVFKDSELKYAIILWLLVVYGYVLLTHAKAVYERGGLSWFWKIHLYPLMIAFLLIDALFNAVFGTLMYLELPRELLFTSRCKRHVEGKGWRQRLALFWRKQLNQFEEGHV